MPRLARNVQSMNCNRKRQAKKCLTGPICKTSISVIQNRLAIGNATRRIPPTTSALTSSPSSSPSTCIYGPNDAFSAASPRWLKLWWQSVRWTDRWCSAGTTGRGPVRAKFWGLHERPDSADGLSGWTEGRNGWPRIHGAECRTHLSAKLNRTGC